MVLDAANVARLGNSMLFLESASGNRAAYDWLCERFPNVNIELCNFYAGVHIDSTIVPLREGLVLVNGSRVTPENLPRSLKDWEVIYCNHVEEQGFFQYPYASKWIALNMLVVDPHRIIVDKNQPILIDFLERNQFEVIPMQLRHSRTLGGGFHCVTLDLHREA
jgi:glycine amidinotransferase/scyllo-inosamine-4-phosphate amidinotransferase 1